MPRGSQFSIIVGTSVLCAVTAASVTAATWPVTHSGANQASRADLAIVTHAQSPALPPAVLVSQQAADLQAQQADGVHGVKDAVARRQHQRELVAVNATAARKARLALLARQAVARAAAAWQAARQAARQWAVAQQSWSGASSSPQTVASASGSAQQIAQQMRGAAGQGGQFSCLDSLWSRESSWSTSASNPGTGAYGIPQALPGVKMASAGVDWQTDAATQIRWGLSYIDGLYGSPCGAWAHEEADGWY